MRCQAATTLAGALAVLPAALAFNHPSPPQITKRDVEAGGFCGSKGGNAACAQNLCCSSDGVCGTRRDMCFAPDCQISFGPACDGNKWPPGKSTVNVPRPKFGNVEYGVDILSCTVPGKVALTFDDGPNKYTSELLNILKKNNNTKATFFITAANQAKGQIEDPTTEWFDIIKRMKEEGHQIGSHTWSHENFSAITPQQRQDQIIKFEMAMVDILGVFPTYLRPPFDISNEEVRKELKGWGYHIVSYDLATDDDRGDPNLARTNFDNRFAHADSKKPSYLVIGHDIQEGTVHGLTQYMIDQAHKYGYELTTVGECLGDPLNNWYRDQTTGAEWLGPAPKLQVAAPSPVSSSAVKPSGTGPSTAASGATVAPKSGSSSGNAPTGTAAAPAATTTKAGSAGRNTPGMIYIVTFLGAVLTGCL